MRATLRALACVVAVTVAVVGTPAAAAPPDGATPVARGTADRGTWVTLVTGDRVEVAAGRPRLIDRAHRSRPAQFARYSERGDWYVVPSDASRLIRAGVVDRELFNVTGLVRQGYDDAHTKVVPLLAEYPDVRSAVAPAGARKGRAFPNLRLAALEERKSDAARFWSTVAGRGALKAGPRKLWLNAKVRASLDQSVPQVGAPVAWQAGHTGKGVTVAVLDTGYDTDHPDFAGRVGPTQNFTGAGTVEDKNGHGTHVASIALGSGAASGGKYKGVAPDAKLAVGKVLDDNGFGTFDGILAGMEWAATTVDAKVVNMSLGGGPSDGTDPVSMAVNRLSKEHGTLFVIAAGNWGRPSTIDAPGAADAALTVGSVSKTDALSIFSSRGPRRGDLAIKPDIAAPGGDIVAARATGTTPGDAMDEHYARHSGTSMASPHVAGAAAILAEQHPDWTGAQLKAALMGAAKPLGGLGPDQIGAGRLDVAQATARKIVAVPGSVSTYLKWPHAGTPAREHTVTYRNTGAEPVTLPLKLDLTAKDGKPAPAGLATLSASTVTVPAGGEAAVTLSIASVEGAVGIFRGVVTAGTGEAAVRTLVGVYAEPEMHSVAVSVKDREGNVPDAESSFGVMMNLDTGAVYNPAPGETLRVPPGRYSAAVSVMTPRPGLEFSLTQLANPEFRVTGDMDLAFDARTGKPLDIRVDRPGVTGGEHMIEHRFAGPGSAAPEGGMILAGDPRYVDHFAASTPGVSSKAYLFHNWLRGEEPAVALTATAPQRYDVMATSLNVDVPAVDATLGAVYGGAGTPEDLAKIDARGKLVTLALPDTGYEDMQALVSAVKAAGARAVLVVPTGEWWLREVGGLALPVTIGFGVTARRLLEASKKDGATTTLVMRPYSRYAYHVSSVAEGSIPAKADFLHRTKDLASIRTGYHVRDGIAANHYVTSVLERDGHQLRGWMSQLAPRGGGEQLEYFTPGTWRRDNASMSGTFVWLHTPPMSLRAGQHRSLSWGKAVTGPNLNAGREAGKGAWVSRTGDKIDVAIPLYSDASGNGMTYAHGRGETILYRDGALHGRVNTPGEAVFEVPPGEAEYRLTTRVQNDSDWPLSTDVSAAWTFRSGHGDQVLPLLSIGFDPKVDFVNHAPGGKAFSFPATVTRQAGSGTAAVRSLTVDVSYDDGATWTPATVTRHGAKWTVSVSHPKSGFVSLRAKAADAQGNTVEQTVVRAYGLK